MNLDGIHLLNAARTYAATGTGRAIRQAAGLSMSEVAEALGVTESTIWRWEQGKHRPRGEPAREWARLLNRLSGTRTTPARHAS